MYVLAASGRNATDITSRSAAQRRWSISGIFHSVVNEATSAIGEAATAVTGAIGQAATAITSAFGAAPTGEINLSTFLTRT